MPMYPCKNCLENRWDFEKIENTIRATCKICGYEVEFPVRKKRPITENSPCRACGGLLILKKLKFKPSKLKKPYYFTHALRCYKCGKMYLTEKYKVVNVKKFDLKTAKVIQHPNGALQVVDKDDPRPAFLN